jgi:hypothetical protein
MHEHSHQCPSIYHPMNSNHIFPHFLQYCVKSWNYVSIQDCGECCIRGPHTLITSWEATPPTKAATGWISAPPNRHISVIRSSDKDAPFKPISLSTEAATVFSLGISSSISLPNPVYNQYYKKSRSFFYMWDNNVHQ